MHLLPSADLVQLDRLDCFGIAKIRNGRVVKGNVSVLANAHNHHVGKVIVQQLPVARRLGFCIDRAAIDQINTCERHVVKDMRAQKIAKALRCISRKPDVFVHVIGVDAAPFNVLVCN